MRPRLRNVLVPLGPHVELSADVYLPARPGPFPTLVSPTPYRKDDYIGGAWNHVVGYFVERGYAHVLADFRGLGGSSGRAADAMSADEAADGRALVEWSAAQPWSTGNVGMYGISYGGISALRTASARPPHLRAIAPMYAATDFYTDFVYPGGCLNCLGVSSWTSLMLAMQLAPPMFQDDDGRWEQVWRARLEHGKPYVLPWLEHPERDDFWRGKAIPVERIDVPAFFIGGWRDLYPEAVPDAYERVAGPRKLWMGPWPHVAPDASPMEPTEFLPQLCRWFDRFVRGVANGIDEEPPVTIFVQGAGAGWRHEGEWPIARARDLTLFLGDGGTLADHAPAAPTDVPYVGDASVGVQAGLWDVRGTGLGLPLDQRADDERSLCFTGPPLAQALEITGSPEASLVVALDERDEANLVVKLCDVDPDGRSSLVTTGWLRLSRPPAFGEHVQLRVPLWATSYRVGAGHRLRVAVSCSDFPRIWPTRSNPRLRLRMGGRAPSSLSVPAVAGGGRPGPAPVSAAPATQPAADWRIERDAAGETSVVLRDRRRLATPGGDGGVALEVTVRATAAATRPEETHVSATTRMELAMPSGALAVVTAGSSMKLDRLTLRGWVDVDGAVVFDDRWVVERA